MKSNQKETQPLRTNEASLNKWNGCWIIKVFDKDLDLGDDTADRDRRKVVEWQKRDMKSAAAENAV